MNNSPSDPFKEAKLKQLQLWLYLMPFVGIFPSLWILYRNEGTPKEKNVSRLAINLGLTWLIIYSLLWLGALSPSEILSFRLLFLNGLLTSGYFLFCFVFMIQIWQGKTPHLFLNLFQKSKNSRK
jgi:hypothetical protein